jgi:putative DNA primase/helicase
MTLILANDLADRLHLRKHPRSWRGRCISCGYDAAFAVKSGLGGRANLWCSNGCSHETLLREAARVTGGDYTPPAQRTSAAEHRTEQDRIEYAQRVWAGCFWLSDSVGAPGRAYLAARGIQQFGQSSALRFNPEAKHPEGGRLPALVGLAVNVDGIGVGLQRVYLTPDGTSKAAVTPQKAGLGILWGAAVRLQEHADGAIVVGEGIETSAAAGQILGLPAWAAVSAGNLAKGLLLPSAIRRVVIAADNDRQLPNGHRPGQDAAETAARRWRAEGRSVEIAMPDREGTDFADLVKDGHLGR